MNTSIWWIRRDLRLADNQALQAALHAGVVVPVFIQDPKFDSASIRRRGFLHEGLHKLDEGLRKRGSYLVIRRGSPIEVLSKLMEETSASAVFAEEDYTPYATKREARVAAELPLKLVCGQVTRPPELVRKADGKPYTVFSAYARAWRESLAEIQLLPAPDQISTPEGIPSQLLPDFNLNALFPAGEEEAQRRLLAFTSGSIESYAERRNRMDLDGTSSLSPYLRFGMLSMNQAVHAAQHVLSCQQPASGAETWQNELIWREFYISILYHFPHVSREAFCAELRDIPWKNDMGDFEAWKQGRTGYPVVDAAMRQLAQTGWMHNRARMIAASFLVKDLLIDWRWGESHFMQHLLDGDPAANNGGWQWTAGTGTDAAPYFRIFNPVLQGWKFDPRGSYVRRFVPELANLPDEFIHEPWKMSFEQQQKCDIRIGVDYPLPIVDHTSARDRTLIAFKTRK